MKPPDGTSPITIVATRARHSIVERLVAGCGIAVTSIGVLVLIGWATDTTVFKSIIPGLIVMIPNTATAFTLAGLSLWLQHRRAYDSARATADAGSATPTQLAARVLAASVLAIGVLSFTERRTSLDFGIDLLLFPEAVRRYPYLPPGRMASNSALSFMFAGAALLCLSLRRRAGVAAARTLAVFGLMVAGLALVGYAYGAQSLYTFDAAAGMALITAVGFFTLHTGILFTDVRVGSITLLTGDDLASALVRRLLPATVALPLLFGWLWKAGREHAFFSRESGVAMFAVAMIASFIALILTTARAVRVTDLERERVLSLEREARAEADAANHVKDEFLATMSHELRTPLNAVIGYASLLGDGIMGELTGPQQAQIGRIAVSAKHLLALIEQVLTLSRIEAGQIDVVVTKIDVVTVVDEAVTLIQPQASQKGLAVHVRVPDDTPRLLADNDRLRQILVNLLANAVKFTDRGEIAVVVRIKFDTVVFEICDSGIGIAADLHEQIFEPFWQADRTRTRRAEGTGLGLTVSRRLARAMGGDIGVAARRGGGSVFTLTMPRSPDTGANRVSRPSGRTARVTA